MEEGKITCQNAKNGPLCHNIFITVLFFGVKVNFLSTDVIES